MELQLFLDRLAVDIWGSYILELSKILISTKQKWSNCTHDGDAREAKESIEMKSNCR